MKKSKQNLLEEVNNMTLEELKQSTFAFLRIKEHIWREFEKTTSENRIREKLRLKIAQKHILTWFNEYK